MSSKPEAEAPKPDMDDDLPVPSWKKIGEYVATVFNLARSIEGLKEKNKNLEAQVDSLQRQADDHAGQLKAILTMINSTVNDRAAQAGEQAALRVFESLLAIRRDQPPKVR